MDQFIHIDTLMRSNLSEVLDRDSIGKHAGIEKLGAFCLEISGRHFDTWTAKLEAIKAF